MIELTAEQHEILSTSGPEPSRAHDPVTDVEYVLVRADVFERIKALVAGEQEWVQGAYAAAMDVFARDGWDDPRMDVYDSLDPRNSQ